jgi:hypothetical protein
MVALHGCVIVLLQGFVIVALRERLRDCCIVRLRDCSPAVIGKSSKKLFLSIHEETNKELSFYTF